MKETGFSLLEVMFVVVIIGLLAGLAGPRPSQTWDRFAVRQAADQFRSAHQKARTAAVRYGGVAELHMNTSTEQFWVQIDTTFLGSGVMDTIGTLIDLSESQVDLRATRSLICFDARGLVATADGCPSTGALGVGFSRGNSSDTIRVTVSGLLLGR